MSNDLVVADEVGFNLPITQADVDALTEQRKLFFKFVQSQLRPNIDAGTIPGTDKPSLYKPGAEKLARLFGLGVKYRRTGETFDRDKNFASFTYKASVFLLRNPEVVIAECEGICNSQEKKYKERKIYETKNGRRECVGTEATPICDVLNTLMKMAQKRAYVGAILMATAASDFFTQDVEDDDDAAALGLDPDKKPASRPAVIIPKATSAKSSDQAGAATAPAKNPDPTSFDGFQGGTPQPGLKVITPKPRAEMIKEIVAIYRAFGVTKPVDALNLRCRADFKKDPTDVLDSELAKLLAQLQDEAALPKGAAK